MTTANTSDAFLSFASPVCHALAEGLTQTCNVSWQCGDVAPAAPGASPQQAQEIYRLSFAKPFEGQCYVAVLPQEGATGDTGQTSATIAAAMQITLQRIRTLLRGHGEEQIAIDAASPEDLPTEDRTELRAELRSEEVQLTVQLVIDAALAESLRQPQTERLWKAIVPSPAVQTNLDLVMDVALSVALRFGRRQLPLREVMELTSGSVVELDRQVDEPVELVLDGRVVARGEAVIIDGNYGMRVTQIVQPLLNV